MADSATTVTETAITPALTGQGDGVAGQPPPLARQVATAFCSTAPPVLGVACRKCGCRRVPVYYTRRLRGFVMRVRECRDCGRRLVTKECEI